MDKRINKTFQDVCKDILEKKSVEHVGAYELMKHDKMKRQCFTGDRAKSAMIASITDPKNARQFYSITNQKLVD